MTNFEDIFLKPVGEQVFKEINPIMLAFIGDAVHTLYIRDKVVKLENLLLKDYHRKSSSFCNAKAQAKVLEQIQDNLSEQELDIVRRARNVKVGHIAKHSDIETYKKSTSLEALIGYLYLKGNFERLKQIFDLANV